MSPPQRSAHDDRRSISPLLPRLLAMGALLLVLQIALVREMAYLSTQDPSDITAFQCYAVAFWQGPPGMAALQTGRCTQYLHKQPRQFHTLPPEYPPLSQAVFSLPLLLPWLSYRAAFMWWMALLILATTALLAWYRSLEAASAFMVYTLVAGWTLALGRFDLVPTVCILVALCLTRRRRLRAAVATLAVGVLLKIFPILLLPVVFMERRRAGGRGLPWDLVLIGGGFLVVGLVIDIVVDPSAIWSPLRFQIMRPPQIESTPAILLWISNAAAGTHLRSIGSYNSINLVAPGADFWSALCSGAGVIGLVIAYARRWQGRDSLERTFLVVLLITVATGKVFSTQYILWPLWLAAYVEGLRLRWLVLALLTLFIGYSYTLGMLSPSLLEAIWIRNALLVAVTLGYLLGPGDERAPSDTRHLTWRTLRQRLL